MKTQLFLTSLVLGLAIVLPSQVLAAERKLQPVIRTQEPSVEIKKQDAVTSDKPSVGIVQEKSIKPVKRYKSDLCPELSKQYDGGDPAIQGVHFIKEIEHFKIRGWLTNLSETSMNPRNGLGVYISALSPDEFKLICKDGRILQYTGDAREDFFIFLDKKPKTLEVTLDPNNMITNEYENNNKVVCTAMTPLHEGEIPSPGYDGGYTGVCKFKDETN